MQPNARPLSHAEQELIELVRGEDTKDPFTLVISFSEGRWIVETRSPGLDGAQGVGENFDQAWGRQEPNWS